MAEMAEEGGDFLVLVLELQVLWWMYITVRDTLRDGQDETSRLEEVGGDWKGCCWGQHPQGWQELG